MHDRSGLILKTNIGISNFILSQLFSFIQMNKIIKTKKTSEKQNTAFKSIIKQLQQEEGVDDKIIHEIDGVVLSEEQQKILALAKEGYNIFLTGDAGTGKSVLLNKIIEVLRDKKNENNKKSTVFVTASTGIAAVNIGGCTIHSLTGIGNGEGDVSELIKKIGLSKNALYNWRMADVIVIDEISMLSAPIFTKLNEIAKYFRRNNNPFGGIQIVVCGDFFQLPPVTKTGPIEFCFESEAWEETIQKNCILTFSFRQKGDNLFLGILKQIKTNTLDSKNEKLLSTRLSTNIKNYKEDFKPVTLYSHKVSVSKENETQYSKLSGIEEEYEWKMDSIKQTDTVDWCNAQKTLKLRVGCQVMLIKNIDFESGLVNGLVGIVEDFSEKSRYPIVKFCNGVKTTIKEEDFDLKIGDKHVTSIKQIPLILAWAITIHKSQGMTLSKVKMGLDKVFEYGQTYVALSRATSLKGLVLLSFDKSKIKVHPKVIKFYKSINKPTLKITNDTNPLKRKLEKNEDNNLKPKKIKSQ